MPSSLKLHLISELFGSIGDEMQSWKMVAEKLYKLANRR